MPDLALSLGFRFEDLYASEGLARIDAAFAARVAATDTGLAARLADARKAPASLEPKAESELLIALARPLEDFIAELFSIRAPLTALKSAQDALAPLYACKRLFVQRRAAKAHKAEDAARFDVAALEAELERLLGGAVEEMAFARAVLAWLDAESEHAAALDAALRYAAWAALTDAGRARWGKGLLFKVPRKVDPAHLIEMEAIDHCGATAFQGPRAHLRAREGFALTDRGTDLKGALDEANYCIWCHAQAKDSCSKGLKDRKTGAFQRSAHGVPLAGCPLEEKISEMHSLKVEGVPIGALAVAIVDNPMLAGTGHRICNDCMKACIYQKQEPVNIPQAETRILKDVLELPWGFEVYSLLTRWNPLNLKLPVAKPASGRRVLVAGLGPAGYTLAHWLLNDGHTVVAIDGLKIEPLPSDLSGVDARGKRVPFAPIRDFATLREPLDDRLMAGFGGVAEYGITVRWDKNFLKVIRLLLERRERFAMMGGVRLGGTITVEQAFAAGFDHVALAMGAGKPTVVQMPNGLARGVRQASDFLMALQLTGAAKVDSIANLQIRLPIVVIGGGLTAIDTATESLAYYPVQVEKFLLRYEALAAERGEAHVRTGWSEEDATVADEYIAHARAIRGERAAAAREGRKPDLRRLLESWGGATVAYRRRLLDAPSYTLNHEEVALAMEEGIRFAEGLTPKAIETDLFGHARAIVLEQAKAPDGSSRPDVTMPARAILVAAGTQPNTVLARETEGGIKLDGRYFQAVDETGAPVKPEKVAKPGKPYVLLDVQKDGRAVSFWGDLHPSFAGNVVKAMGGAKQGWPVVARQLATLPQRSATASGEAAFLAHWNAELRAVVHEVKRLTPTIIEVILHAPAAARNFLPGQFYRLQNFEALAPRVDGTRLTMEGLALTGAWTDKARGLLSVIVLEMGGSSDLCATLKPQEPVILMGPTGMPTEIEPGETVLLAGGGLGNAVLFSIGRAFRAAGSKVLYFAGYKRLQDRYKVEEIEAAADVVIWACDEAPGFVPGRVDDRSFVGNIVAAMVAYQTGKLGAPPAIDLKSVDRIIAIGSDRMMEAVAKARHAQLKPFLKPGHVAFGSINSPMQCMMKEICAQCLQPHRDPATGEETVVFSCFNQDQLLDRVDWAQLNARLRQNSLQEKLTAQWIDRCVQRLVLNPMVAAD